MSIDPEIKKMLDMKLVTDEITIDEYRSRLKVLEETSELTDAVKIPDRQVSVKKTAVKSAPVEVQPNRSNQSARSSGSRPSRASNDIVRAAHETKSYVGAAFLTWLLYYVGFFIIGLILNFVFLSQAGQTRNIIGRNPSGYGCLQFLIWTHCILPIIIAAVVAVIILGNISL